jgi:hypothetical protein
MKIRVKGKRGGYNFEEVAKMRQKKRIYKGNIKIEGKSKVKFMKNMSKTKKSVCKKGQ